MTRRLIHIGMLLIGGALLCQPAGAASTERVNIGSNGGESGFGGTTGSISADGRYVAFNVRSDEVGGSYTIHVRDRQTGTTEHFSGHLSFRPAISADGRFVAFDVSATNLIEGFSDFDVFVRDRQTATTEKVSVTSNAAEATGSSVAPSVNADGLFVAFTSAADNLVASDTTARQTSSCATGSSAPRR